MLSDCLANSFGGKQLPLIGLNFYQAFGRLVTVQRDLRFNRVFVRRKGMGFNQNLVASFRWAVKRRHHQMQIDRQRVHHDHFIGLTTN